MNPDSLKTLQKVLTVQHLQAGGEVTNCLHAVEELLYSDKQTTSSYLFTVWAKLQQRREEVDPQSPSLDEIEQALRTAVMLDPFDIHAMIELAWFLYSVADRSKEALHILSKATTLLDDLKKQVLELQLKCLPALDHHC